MYTLEDINEEIQNTKNLIRIRTSGLQKLRERDAKHGLDVPLSLQNEIEMFGEKLDELQIQLDQLLQEKAQLEPPLVYLHTYGAANVPPGAFKLFWSDHFNRDVSPRKIPSPDVWTEELLPELKKIRDETIKKTGLIRLQGTIALSAGFALGAYFSRVGQYQIEVRQGPEKWRSDGAIDVKTPKFSSHPLLSGDEQAADLAVLVVALSDQNSATLINDVTHYLNDSFKRLMLLEADTVTRQGDRLKGDDAAVLARTSLPILRNFVGADKDAILHIFLAVPAGLAVFLGHQWNALGITAQLHEFVGGTTKYAPSCRLALT